MEKQFEPVIYEKKYEKFFITMLTVVRKNLDINGRHSLYKDIDVP